MPLYKPFPKFIPRPVITIFIGLFIMVWLTMMMTALTGALCGNPDKPDAKRLRGCNISIPLGNLLPGENHKKASLYLQRGILRANAGATDLARADMAEALDRATRGQPHRAIQIWAEAQRYQQDIKDAWKRGERPMMQGRDSYSWVAELFLRILTEPAGSPAKRIWAEVVMKAEGG